MNEVWVLERELGHQLQVPLSERIGEAHLGYCCKHSVSQFETNANCVVTCLTSFLLN